ncbi:d-4,5 unsaturated-glucuronyl hydrolase-like protein [Dentipellis sp. KUC8613]|nr:d-4,5 unsaturated-glucuronyl hydrolase-like protein [Dentipellis sp. KUC8613]
MTLRIGLLALFPALATALAQLAPDADTSSLPHDTLFSPLIETKLRATAHNISGTPTQYPQYTTRDSGEWIYFPADGWTTGFLPATFYALRTRAQLCGNSSGEAEWLEEGRRWATGEVPLETHTGVGHDVGFLSFPFVQELELNPTNASAIEAVNDFANHLAGRFSPIVGCTRSWDSADPTDFQVIIDNMMNLEVLFVSEGLTGNHTLRDIAMSHADKTMVNHVRADGSCGSFHVVDYNATTGAVIDQRTSQGYSNSSTWSRGQAWGIYGFANNTPAATVHQRTGEQRYLDTARRMASYFIDNLPSDNIVPWDFNAPLDPPRPADSSAAMIATNGLFLLALQENSLSPANNTGALYYTNAAIKILSATTNAFWKPEWNSLLSNGTVNNPANPPNNLTGIVYGDYYYINAGNQLLLSGLARCH